MREKTTRLALAAGVLAAISNVAEAGDWIADAKSGCQVWNPRPSPGEAVAWTGACVNGRAEGKGTLDWLRRGEPYERDEGTWRDGKQEGTGIQTWPGGRYSGQIANSLPQGQGSLLSGDAQYEGGFASGIPNGRGTLTNPSGIFTGLWQAGCFNDGKRRVSAGVPLASCP